jgi:hypothetical protein
MCFLTYQQLTPWEKHHYLPADIVCVHPTGDL